MSFYPQHLFPDADQDLEDLEIEQQQLLFNKMESNKDAKWDQGPQVQTDYFLDFNIFLSRVPGIKLNKV